MKEHNQKSRKRQEQENYSAYMADRCYQYLLNLLIELDMHLDRRLVQTFLGLVIAIVIHRHRNNGLLLSELGGYLLDPEHAPAGTKRISNLLHSSKWSSRVIENYLWEQADQRVAELNQAEEQVVVVWDESVIEKPESLHLEGLCAVKSSKAKRLKRIKPGYYHPPGGRPIFVPGYNWLQVLVMGMTGPPTVATMRWWSTRGDHASDRRSEEREVLREVSKRWGADVLHIWDRGFAGNPWLTLAYVHAVRFVLRWPKSFKLLDGNGQPRKPGEISKGKRSWEYRLLWDARRRCNRKTSSPFKWQTPPTINPSGWSLFVAKANPPGICSPVSPSAAPTTPGRLHWLTFADGMSNCPSVLTSAN